MAEVQQVNISCECYHRHGLLYVLRPWAWGRPCRRCARMMDRNVVVVPSSGQAVAVSHCAGRSSPAVVKTTTTTQSMAPQPQMMNAPQQPQMMNAPQQPQMMNAPQQPQMMTVTPAQTTQNWQVQQQAYPSVLPPTYELVAAK